MLAGPFAGYQLALQGADVIKVELPGSGDLARRLGADRALSEELLGASFLAQNGGKRSLTLNLKDPEGRAALLRAVREADVLLENFRPGVLDRLGLGWDTLRAENPGLVYCAISGFGQTGPLRDRPAYDQIIQGLSGMMSVTGTAATAPCGPASRSPTPWAAWPPRTPSPPPWYGAGAPARARSSTSRCWRPRSPRWAG